MKAIDIRHAEIGLVTSRVDGGISFKVITPELNLEQRATVLGLHGIDVRVMVEALDVPTTGLDLVETKTDGKTPCQRLRAVLFVHWNNLKAGGVNPFEAFYQRQMDKIIEGYKSKNLPE